MSLPARGAWIEMTDLIVSVPGANRRSPQGERGLKYLQPAQRPAGQESLPARGAWIEIPLMRPCVARSMGRSPQGERGLKCCKGL